MKHEVREAARLVKELNNIGSFYPMRKIYLQQQGFEIPLEVIVGRLVRTGKARLQTISTLLQDKNEPTVSL